MKRNRELRRGKVVKMKMINTEIRDYLKKDFKKKGSTTTIEELETGEKLEKIEVSKKRKEVQEAFFDKLMFIFHEIQIEVGVVLSIS